MSTYNNNDISTNNKRNSRKFTEDSEGKPLTEALLKWWIGRKPSKTRNIWHGNGLFIRITTTGKMIWKLNYSIPKTGKRSIMTLGHYTDKNNLEWAIIEASKKTAQAQNNIDPFLEQKKLKDIDIKHNKTFKEVANLWYEDKIKHSTSTNEYKQNIKGRIIKHLYPVIGEKIYKDITFEMMYDLITNKYKEQIDKNNKPTNLLKMLISDLYTIGKWAKKREYINENFAEDLFEECKWIKPIKSHLTAITDHKKIGELLNKLELFQSKGYETVKKAIIFIIYIPVRFRELTRAKVNEFDFNRNVWTIPKERMKMRKEFEVPLPDKMIDMIKKIIEENKYGTEDLIFQYNGKEFYKNLMRYCLRKLGYNENIVTIHGYRSTFSTLMREADIYNEEIIERNLAHSYGGIVSQAYNRGSYIEKRRRCYEDYGYILDGLKSGKTFDDIVMEIKRKHFEEYINDNNRFSGKN